MFLLFNMSLVCGCRLGVMADEERQQKWVLMHQESMCEFKREVKFEMEEKIWR